LKNLTGLQLLKENGFWISFLVAFLIGMPFFIGSKSNPTQPIAFNHNKHLEAGMDCMDCHVGAREQTRATLPDISVCLMCHEESATGNPEEIKIQQAAAKGEPLAWQRIQRLPAHVYFSHRRHVALAGLECVACHGPMETLSQPPRRPFLDMTMEACQDCHENANARNDCNDCHR